MLQEREIVISPARASRQGLKHERDGGKDGYLLFFKHPENLFSHKPRKKITARPDAYGAYEVPKAVGMRYRNRKKNPVPAIPVYGGRMVLGKGNHVAVAPRNAFRLPGGTRRKKIDGFIRRRVSRRIRGGITEKIIPGYRDGFYVPRNCGYGFRQGFVCNDQGGF